MVTNRQTSVWQIWIDTGGTFTDCIAVDPKGEIKKAKVLSSSSLRGKLVATGSAPNIYKINQEWGAPDDFVTGFRFKWLDQSEPTATVTAFDSKRSILTLDQQLQPTDLRRSFELQSDEEAPVLAARLVTQTPRQQPLPPLRLRLATTKATNALLEEKGAPTVLLFTEGFEDLLEIGNQQRPDLFALNIHKRKPIYEQVVGIPERLDAAGNVLKSINTEVLESPAGQLLEEGITSAAVVLMHSYKNDRHEQKLKKWLLEKGFCNVSLSSELSPFIKIIPRAETTLVNAYLAPIIQQYLDEVQSAMQGRQMYVMTSAGGLTAKEDYTPKDSLLSGPAGGVVGAAAAGSGAGYSRLISFDMGGTSTDVARYDNEFDYVFEHTVGAAQLVAPALNIETVAAGGGSVCYFDGHKLCVGPQSAGASPGPACYGEGGPLTLTDVNLLSGRLDDQNFHIPVDIKAAEHKLDAILAEIEVAQGEQSTRKEILSGFLSIANERMADAIRNISVRKGYDVREYAMVAFGGAGGQHACAIAEKLGIESVLIPENAGLLSAHGIGHARIEAFEEIQVLKPLRKVKAEIDRLCEEMAGKAADTLVQTGIDKEAITVHRQIVSMRLEGQETALDIDYNQGMALDKAFRKAYKQRYGHWITGRTIQVQSIRVVVAMQQDPAAVPPEIESRNEPTPAFHKNIWFEGKERQSPVFLRWKLRAGDSIRGPALILDPYSTIVVGPGWQALLMRNGTLEMKHDASSSAAGREVSSEVVNLELFTNRFSAIAVEMGEMLQRTALSVNVKDRMDFSCALLSAEGSLVVNAPHIPVHLGAMGLCVRRVKGQIAMEPGDVIMTNHPAFGGSHLPDVTLITPIFTEENKLIGYAASRAHHAEIGGITPGSMPPTATSLEEEGVVIPPMYAVKKGTPRWKEIRRHLQTAAYPTRNVEENIADMQAAVAANQRGAEGIRQLCRKHGSSEVKRYMKALHDHAESKMRSTLKNIPSGQYVGEEYLDDGTPLKVTMDIRDDQLSVDFSGTGEVHSHNLNATPAIVNSVLMYVFRLLIGESIPLNDGILSPVQVNLPVCLLNPDFKDEPAECPAVVGGNIEVSQRLVDTLLKPFEVAACSQGTMNNVLFGNDHFGYYETVGGGTGAGPSFEGADAVHQHMTNTRGTDPEVLEHQYPVRLDRYAIRKGSGGTGAQQGGDGIIRKLTFLEPVELTVLTQHRTEGPYGLQGGEAGKPGKQIVLRSSGAREVLKSVDGRALQKGDVFILKTPGGGGFGTEP